MTRTQFKRYVQGKDFICEFVKLDGSNRIMNGTLALSRIPRKLHPKTNKPYSEKVVRVFDLEKEAWRSINLETIKKLETV